MEGVEDKLVQEGMPFFTAPRMTRWARRSAIVTVVGLGMYGVDHYFFSRVCSRSLYTVYNGVIIIYKLKMMKPGINFEEVHDDVSDRILSVCRNNGGLYIKFGQQIAGMGHMLPPQYGAKFKVLYDDAPTVNFKEVEQIFQEEFGKGPSEIFSEFDPAPIASASIAQVHKAKLLNGTKVAVKIQKPELQTQVTVDLFMYKTLARVLEFAFGMPILWTIDYQIKHLKEELNFINEASNGERAALDISRNSNLSKQVYIPKIYHDITSRRVMTAEWIEGVKFSDVDGMLKTGYDLPKIMNTIVAIFAYQIFFTGFLHCDPHPGNMIIRPNPQRPSKPQIVLLDHGLYITESEKFRQQYQNKNSTSPHFPPFALLPPPLPSSPPFSSPKSHLYLMLQLYCYLWKSLLTMDMKKVTEICNDWGVDDPAGVAMLTLSKPYNPNKAVDRRIKEVSYKDVMDMQTHFKKNLNTFLTDTSRIPLELIFVGRNLNIVRGNNKYLGSPVKRIIMADWAQLGIGYDVARRSHGIFARAQYALSARWSYIKYRSTLFALSVGFYSFDLWKRVNRYVRGIKYAEDEFDDEWVQESKQKQMDQYGMAIDERNFNA